MKVFLILIRTKILKKNCPTKSLLRVSLKSFPLKIRPDVKMFLRFFRNHKVKIL